RVTGVKTDPNRDAKALVPDAVTAPTARRIFEMRSDGYAWSAIVSTLNEAGVPSPSGGEGVRASLATIVRFEGYTGGVVPRGGRPRTTCQGRAVAASAGGETRDPEREPRRRDRGRSARVLGLRRGSVGCRLALSAAELWVPT